MKIDFTSEFDGLDFASVLSGKKILSQQGGLVQPALNPREEVFGPSSFKKSDLEQAQEFRESVTIQKDLREVFVFLRNFSNLPLFMSDLFVGENTEDQPRWKIGWSLRPNSNWDVEVTEQQDDQFIAWKSLKDSKVQQEGWIYFREAPGQRGTMVSFFLRTGGGKVLEMAEKLVGEDSKTLILKNLRKLKAYLEAGEIPSVEGQPTGRDHVDAKSEYH